MSKEKIVNHLQKFDYSFSESGNTVVVELDFSLQIIIDLSEPDRIRINDRLKTWNFLSWPFSMSIKKSMIMNFIAFVFCTLLFLNLAKTYDPLLQLVYMACIFWSLYWQMYYLLKAESFKRQLIDLLK